MAGTKPRGLEHWHKLFADHALSRRSMIGDSLSAAERRAVTGLVARWRSRLVIFSWLIPTLVLCYRVLFMWYLAIGGVRLNAPPYANHLRLAVVHGPIWLRRAQYVRVAIHALAGSAENINTNCLNTTARRCTKYFPGRYLNTAVLWAVVSIGK